MAGPELTVKGTINDDIINLLDVSAGVTGFVTAGRDAINSFAGNDAVAGGKGDDTAFLGEGDDTFTWNAGDGADIVLGDTGFDTLIVNGDNSDESIIIGNNGDGVFSDTDRVIVSRPGSDGDVEAEAVERIEIHTLGGKDSITIERDLGTTGVRQIAIDLAGSIGGTSGDAQVDDISLGGTENSDHIAILESGTGIVLNNGSTEIRIDHIDAGLDRLAIKAFGGDDVIDASTLSTSPILDLNGAGGDDALISGSANDRLEGGEGNDVLTGGAGADALEGDQSSDTGELAGTDTASYATSDAGVFVSLATGTGSGGHAEGDTLSHIENLVGSAFADTLAGDAKANVLDGGDGSDTASYAASDGGVTVNLLAATSAGGHAEGDTLISIENLVGSAFADALTGDNGANRLDGGAGPDAMAGGLGNDVYIVDDLGDIIVEAADGGADTVLSSVAFTLGDGLENLTLIGQGSANGGALSGDIAATGNALANTITGNDAGNFIDGGVGNDRLDGGAGEDTVVGGAGTDSLAGGFGKDLLTGGKGKDQFLFDTTLDAVANVDTIADFKAGKDAIGLELDIFASLKLGDLKGKAFFEGKKAHDKSDHVIYNDKTGALFYDADGKGGATAVKFAVLAPKLDLSHDDFFVV